MKFLNIAIASVALLVGNANAADNASSDEFLTRKGKRPSKPSRRCREESLNIQDCIEDVLAQNTKGTRRFRERLASDNRTARTCVARAFDDQDIWDCYSNVITRIGRRCPVVDFKEACKLPYEFEDFALDLAEELEDGAFWEDEEEEEEEEFLARKGGKGSKKQTKACQNAYMGVQNCVEDILARNTNATRNWEKKIFRANRSARVCANNAIYDEDKLDCYSNVIDRIARRCPVPVDDFKEACKIPLEFEAEDEELESTAYATYLRA